MKLEQILVDGDTAPVPQLADPQDRRPILSTRRVSGWTLAVRKIGPLNLQPSDLLRPARLFSDLGKRTHVLQRGPKTGQDILDDQCANPR
jgi:hypothetical protein